MQEQAYPPSPSSATSDSMLVEQTLLGDQRAFEALVGRYYAPLLQFIRSYLGRAGDHEQAEDILQHVLLQLYRSLPVLHATGSLRPWLFRVARNRCVDEQRRRHSSRTLAFSALAWQTEENEVALILDPHPSPEEIAEQHDLQRIVQRAIAMLPPKLRAVAHLRYNAQLRFSEIAQTLNMTETAAKTSFHRARLLLRTALTTP